MDSSSADQMGKTRTWLSHFLHNSMVAMDENSSFLFLGRPISWTSGILTLEEVSLIFEMLNLASPIPLGFEFSFFRLITTLFVLI